MPSFRAQFRSRFFLKHHMALILLGTGFSGVLANRWLFSLGVEHLVVRYPIAVLFSFASFLILMRLWLAYISRAYAQPVAITNIDNHDDTITSIPHGTRSKSKRSRWNWDGSGLDGLTPDEPCGCLLVLFIILLVGIFIIAVSLIADAPLILAEAAFQFLLAGGLIRAAKRIDRPDWIGSIISRTWKPFVVVLVGTLLFGIFAELSCQSPTTIRHIINSCKGERGI